MPRCARVKSGESIYHVMVRSVGDIPLFKNDDDKDYFMEKIKKYMDIFMFKIYSYCIMDTHAHFLIDSNGADISKFMQSINLCYAQYYNRKYKRHGHVFADRFKSIIVNDEKYLINLSGYIHKNPSDLDGYEESYEDYRYSSLGVYLGIFEDRFAVLDTGFILQHFSNKMEKARILYAKMVNACTDAKMKEIVEFKTEKSEYRSERTILIRNYTKDQIVEFVSNYSGECPDDIHIKGTSKTKNFRAVCILLMRSLCNFTYKEICAIIGNITISQASRLSMIGLELIRQDKKYHNIIHMLIQECRKSDIA